MKTRIQRIRNLLVLASCLASVAAGFRLAWVEPPLENQGTGYMFQHAGEDGVFTNIIGVPTGQTNCAVYNLLSGLHSFRGYSTNSKSSSGPSVAVTTNLFIPLFAPTTLSISPIP